MLSRLTAARSDDGEAIDLFALALDRAGRYDEAIPAYERSRELGKASAEDLARLGGIREERKEYSDAMEAYAAAVKAAPKSSATWFSRARLRLTVAGDCEHGLGRAPTRVGAGELFSMADLSKEEA